MSRNNWVEGEFQQIWEGWGVPVLFTGPLLSGGFCALAGAVLGARSRLCGSRLSAAMGPPRDRAGSWRHPECRVWGPAARLPPVLWRGCVAAACWLSCPFPGVTAGSAGRGSRAAAPWGMVAPSGTALLRYWDLAQTGAWGAEGALHSPGQHPVLAGAELGWLLVPPRGLCAPSTPLSLADQKAAGLFASRATVGTLFLFPLLLAF